MGPKRLLKGYKRTDQQVSTSTSRDLKALQFRAEDQQGDKVVRASNATKLTCLHYQIQGWTNGTDSEAE